MSRFPRSTRWAETQNLGRIAGLLLLLGGVPCPARAQGSGDPVAGEDTHKLYCASCHGPQGKGDGAAAALLPVKPRDFTDCTWMGGVEDDYLVTIIQKGGIGVGKSPIMPPWGAQLGDQQIRNLVAYIRKLATAACEPGGGASGRPQRSDPPAGERAGPRPTHRTPSLGGERLHAEFGGRVNREGTGGSLHPRSTHDVESPPAARSPQFPGPRTAAEEGVEE